MTPWKSFMSATGQSHGSELPVRGNRACVLAQLASMLLLAVSLAITLYPAGAASARGIHTRGYDVDQYKLENLEPIEYSPIDFEAEISDIVEADYSFVDEETGASLHHYPDSPSDASLPADEFIPPSIESIEIQRGEECLHAEGTCPACDELRDMYRDGEIDALYRATITPDVDTSDRFTLSVPLDREVQEYTDYRCVDGNLDTSYSPIFISSDPDSGLSTIEFTGSTSELQSPYGIDYDKGRPKETSTRSVHAYTPDDDDDEPEWQTVLINVLTLVAFVAVFAGICYLIGWIRYKVENLFRR